MLDAAMRLKAPKPPRAFNEDKGREEENPIDPDYLEAMQRYRYDTGMLSVSTYFVMGTSVHGDLPDGLVPVSSDEWVDLVQAADPTAEIPATGNRRYLAWLKYYALTDNDATRLLSACVRYSGGTLEVDVNAAQATFRGDTSRDSTNGVHAPDGSGFRDSSGTEPGNGSGVRSEGSSGLRALPLGEMGDDFSG